MYEKKMYYIIVPKEGIQVLMDINVACEHNYGCDEFHTTRVPICINIVINNDNSDDFLCTCQVL